LNHFWVFNQLKGDPDGERELALDGVIAEESWFDDEVTPAAFRAELMQGTGDIVVRINSPGGDCVAAAQIYNMLCEYPGKVTVRIDGIAASAASVVAMAGDHVSMSPVSLMMIHNPWAVAIGNSEYMRQGMQMLDEVKESIINAYETKTALPRAKLSALMDAETWMSSGRALELGFADDVSKPAKKKSAAAPDEEDDPDKDNALIGKAGANQAPRFAYAMHGVDNAAVMKALAKVQGAAPEGGGQATTAATTKDFNPSFLSHHHTLEHSHRSYLNGHPLGTAPTSPDAATDRDKASFALALAQADASL